MLKKNRRWPMMMALIAAFLITGVAVGRFIMAQLTQGTIELPAELPSRKMMAQITANLDRLSKPGSPFSRSSAFGVTTILDYADKSGLGIMITLESSATADAVLAAEPTWQGSISPHPIGWRPRPVPGSICCPSSARRGR